MAGEPGQARGRCTPSLSLRQRRKQQPDRVVAHPQELGDPQSRRYCGNQTTTTKYNLLTFIPKSLFEQYRCVGALAGSGQGSGAPVACVARGCCWRVRECVCVRVCVYVCVCGGDHAEGQQTPHMHAAALSCHHLPAACVCVCRRVANIYFTLVAALSLTDYSPVRCGLPNHEAACGRAARSQLPRHTPCRTQQQQCGQVVSGQPPTADHAVACSGWRPSNCSATSCSGAQLAAAACTHTHVAAQCSRRPTARCFAAQLPGSRQRQQLLHVPSARALIHRIVACAVLRCRRPWTTFLPLAIVLGVAMVKEAVEDYKRHRQDVEVNNRAVQVRRAPAAVAVMRSTCTAQQQLLRNLMRQQCSGHGLRHDAAPLCAVHVRARRCSTTAMASLRPRRGATCAWATSSSCTRTSTSPQTCCSCRRRTRRASATSRRCSWTARPT
jgi:hypothetical protein